MSNIKRALHTIDNVMIMTGRALNSLSETDNPLFTIDQSTVNKITTFRKTHPDITKEFVDREINAALGDMVERMAREYKGNV